MCSRFDRPANFRDALSERRQAGGKSGGNCRDVNAASLQGMQSGFDEGVIHADSAHFYAKAFDPKFLHKILLDGLPCLRAESAHTLVRVVS